MFHFEKVSEKNFGARVMEGCETMNLPEIHELRQLSFVRVELQKFLKDGRITGAWRAIVPPTRRRANIPWECVPAAVPTADRACYIVRKCCNRALQGKSTRGDHPGLRSRPRTLSIHAVSGRDRNSSPGHRYGESCYPAEKQANADQRTEDPEGTGGPTKDDQTGQQQRDDTVE